MGDYFVCSKTDPVVETKAGKVRGFRLNTTYAFHGIHYAEADRFQMPQPVKPWKGIKNALAYGYVCPLLKRMSRTWRCWYRIVTGRRTSIART